MIHEFTNILATGVNFMSDQGWFIKVRNHCMLVLLCIALASCNFPGYSVSGPTQEISDEPTSPPTETQETMIAPTASPTTESIPEPSSTPTSTPPPELPGQCRPFPDQIYPVLENGYLLDQMWVKCGGSSEPYLVHSPVEGLYWDYSNQTGKLVYGLEYSPGPEDLDVWIGDYSLWVYDFRTDLSTQWIQGGVLEAQWAPEVDLSGIQQLAVLLGDGNVAIVTGPEQIETLVNIDRYDLEMEACCIAWSPKSDKLAYAKNETLYVIPTIPQEPRMLAENAFGRPIWVLDQQLLLFPSSVIKVARADGTGPYIPNIPDGNRIWAMPERVILWDPESSMLVFDEFHITGAQQAVTWVYHFSEDFETVVELYSFQRKDDSYLLAWYEPGNSIITSNGDLVNVLPAFDPITLDGVIEKIYPGRYVLWLEGDPYPFISVSLRASIKDRNGDRASILDLTEGLKIRVTGRSIADKRGFLADEIQIIDEE